MKREIDPSTFGFNFKLTPTVFQPRIPRVEVEFSDQGSAEIEKVSDAIDSSMVVAAGEILCFNRIQIESSGSIEVVGSLVSFGTEVLGDGFIFGPGNVQ